MKDFENYSNKEIKNLYKQMDGDVDKLKVLQELTTYSKGKLKLILES